MTQTFLLLQINDAAFPVGAFTHSFGLETYILDKKIPDADAALRYITQNLFGSYLYSDLLPVKLAWQATRTGNLNDLVKLEELLYASRSPRETREAQCKLGNRFAKAALLLDGEADGSVGRDGGDAPEASFFARYLDAVGRMASRPVAYSVFCTTHDIVLNDALSSYLYAHVSSMVTCCLKTVPLSQTDGQKILDRIRPRYPELLAALENLNESDLARSCPGLELRSMQHERLYSRMYMS
ncbi:MAG: urease accessory protein UreF [Actinomycetes bacterium]|jgi:urease accessory protein|nr:urease accessory protein UreF [Actinomycetes bacterium]